MVSEVESTILQNAPVQYIDLSVMPIAQKIALKKKLKTELVHVRTRIGCFGGHSERLSVNDFPSSAKEPEVLEKASSSGKELGPVSRKRKLPERREQQKEVGDISYDEESVIEKSEAVSCVTAAFKGDNPGRLEGKDTEGLKMDFTKIKQCRNVLLTLMNHKHGWLFNQPVDPVALCIPDYFSIIQKPMDLGTIKGKLERKRYLTTHEFAADVRLTFSNAMNYNPPDNVVHVMAKNLNKIFTARWESLEFKWKKECPNSSQQSLRKTKSTASKGILQRVPSCNSSTLSSRSLTPAEKLKLQNNLANISRRNIPPRLLKFLQKSCLLEPAEERIHVDIDSLEETVIWQLYQIVRSCEEAGYIKPAGLMKNLEGVTKECCKGNVGGSRDTSGDKACASPSADMDSNRLFVGADCTCSRHDELSQAPISDVDSQGSSRKQSPINYSVASSWDGENFPGVQGNNAISDTVFRMGTAVVDIDNAQHNSKPSKLSAASPLEEFDFPCEEQLSPTRALRAAKLKSRFADTILKAQQKTLLNHGDKGDPARMQREREKLEKRRQEEKARIEAQVKAAEAAVRKKAETEVRMQRERAEAELRLQREREREAARVALQKMEKTVDIDENSRFFKDLVNLGYSKPLHLDLPNEMMANFMDAVEQQCALSNPLAQLGLFMKEDDLEEDIDNWISSTRGGDAEEGEIGS